MGERKVRIDGINTKNRKKDARSQKKEFGKNFSGKGDKEKNISISQDFDYTDSEKAKFDYYVKKINDPKFFNEIKD